MRGYDLAWVGIVVVNGIATDSIDFVIDFGNMHRICTYFPRAREVPAAGRPRHAAGPRGECAGNRRRLRVGAGQFGPAVTRHRPSRQRRGERGGCPRPLPTACAGRARHRPVGVLGFQSIDDTLALAAGDSLARDYRLGPAVVPLQPIIVTAAKRSQLLSQVLTSVALVTDTAVARRAVTTWTKQ